MGSRCSCLCDWDLEVLEGGLCDLEEGCRGGCGGGCRGSEVLRARAVAGPEVGEAEVVDEACRSAGVREGWVRPGGASRLLLCRRSGWMGWCVGGVASPWGVGKGPEAGAWGPNR